MVCKEFNFVLCSISIKNVFVLLMYGSKNIILLFKLKFEDGKKLNGF